MTKRPDRANPGRVSFSKSWAFRDVDGIVHARDSARRSNSGAGTFLLVCDRTTRPTRLSVVAPIDGAFTTCLWCVAGKRR